jgi:putative two-component system response regulator
MERNILNSKILVVDDNPINVALLEAILEVNGYADVHATTDPREVLPLFEIEKFDLILLDIRMPHMNGIEVMERLHAVVEDDYLPILVLTAQTDSETRRQALSAGAKDFLSKPFEEWEILLRIRNMLETRVYYNGQKIRADVLEGKVRERTKQLRDTQLEIIHRLGRAGEFRDDDTGAHVLRMSKSCHLLAIAAGLDEDHAEEILFASPMHDVGKIGIPDKVLLKPGKLDADEWEIMKTHATIGGDIVGTHSSKIITMARVIAETHHEKWDGTGYPSGLEGENIPIESRIAAICDVFDALTSARPYKKAWPIEKALTFINEQAGVAFDPTLVHKFNEIYPEILRVRDQFPD